VGIAAGSGGRVVNCTPAYNPPSRSEDPMEADEINAIDNTLADIAQRAAELRRYL
jgi:hypothetical protein